MLKPNTNRVLIKPISRSEKIPEGSIIENELIKAGEDIFVGRVVHGGDTGYVKGQIVYYAEYSASLIFDMGKFIAGKETEDEARSDSNIFVLVAKDDVMASEEKKSIWKPTRNSA